MYIPYDKIFNTFALFTSAKNAVKLKEIGQKLKFKSNLKYIEKNKKQVIKKLKRKLLANEKINVAFYVYEETKWKSQSVYDIFENDERFIPYIFVTKNCSSSNNMNCHN